MLSDAQVAQLLRPINPVRVLKDGKGHAHVSQQDVLAHLIRVFGFCAFDVEVKDVALVFESERTDKPGKWDVCYRALVRLTIRGPEGEHLATYENGSTATAQNQTRGDAHDLAYKSAISLSVKRCCINLGDQFGLSLYNKGQLEALVRGSIVIAHDGEDVQEGVPQQVALGNDEIEPEPEARAPFATFEGAVKAAGALDAIRAKFVGWRVEYGAEGYASLTEDAMDELRSVVAAAHHASRE